MTSPRLFRRRPLVPPVLCLTLSAALSSSSGAVSVYQLKITERDGSYRTLVEARLEAPAEDVWGALTDYSNYVRLSPSIHRVQRLGRNDNGVEWVKTWSEACVFGFCKQIRQLQELREESFGELRAQILPGEDIASGNAAWSLKPEGSSSRLRFEAEMTPAFWVPPVVGPWAIRRALARELTASLHNLERLALEVDRR